MLGIQEEWIQRKVNLKHWNRVTYLRRQDHRVRTPSNNVSSRREKTRHWETSFRGYTFIHGSKHLKSRVIYSDLSSGFFHFIVSLTRVFTSLLEDKSSDLKSKSRIISDRLQLTVWPQVLSLSKRVEKKIKRLSNFRPF